MGLVVFNSGAIADLLEIEMMGTPGLVAGVIADYKISSRFHFTNVEQALKTKDLILLERSAHSLKSSSRLVGLEQLGEVAYRIEEAARNGHVSTVDVEGLREHYPTALDELNKFKLVNTAS